MRAIAWFSCGIASAVNAKIMSEKYGDMLEIVYCDVLATEHPDNQRFMKDIETWINQKVTIISSDDYSTIDDVFERTKYMAGIAGARCTTEMKKVPRFRFQNFDDIHSFGFTYDENKRALRLENNNPELRLDWPLIDNSITKSECYRIIERAGIEIPMMYKLGYKNNNCLGCVKATSAKYWNMVRRDFPDVFDRRVRQSRRLGVRLTRYKGNRIFLDELPSDYMPADDSEDISCGPDCGLKN